nr:MAG TPA: hypothetical protein [Caudoviricetes sp.]
MIFIKFLNKIIINIAKLLSYHPVWVVFFCLSNSLFPKHQVK